MLNLTPTSKYIAYILRHRPDEIGITLDPHGWANVAELIEGVSKTHPLTMELLERIVAEDGKQRYTFDETRMRIRANQGHSVPVDVELEEKQPPEILWHGTARRFTESINAEGLKSQNRLYVHLSMSRETAVTVGRRHGNPALYQVDAKRMHEDGFRFYLSKNGVWLVSHVPPEYLHPVSDWPSP